MAKSSTLKDVAARVGVHSSTVSRVMNPATRHLVSHEVAKRVLSVTASMDYRANRAAISLRTRRTQIIGVLLPDITNPVFPPILRGIEEELRKAGYVALVADVGDDKEQYEMVQQMLSRQVDGLILATATRRDPIIDYCIANAVPVVTVNRAEDLGRTSSVVHDEGVGMRIAVSHLTGLGHRKIGHVAGPQHISTGFLRRRGFIEAMAAAKISAREYEISDAAPYTRACGREVGLALLRKRPDLTAIVAANDLVALGCYDALRELGLRCPKDMSVVGHNDMPFVDLVSPPLTTVRISHHELGIQAARLILRRTSGEDSSIVDIRLKPELILRASTASPRRRAGY
jgi:LacI family transcriptional regulator